MPRHRMIPPMAGKIIVLLSLLIICPQALGQIVKLDGSPTCFRALEELSKEYAKTQKGVSFRIGGGGSYLALEELGQGKVDIAYVEYPLLPMVDKAWDQAFPKGKKPNPIDGQKAIIYSLYDLLTTPGIAVNVRLQRIMLNLDKYGFFPPLLRSRIMDGVENSPEKGAKSFNTWVKNTKGWKKLADTILCATAFAQNGLPSPLSIYISYEIASGEGFHVFGQDAFSDVIATEGGRLFAAELLSENSAITAKADIVPQIEAKLTEARNSFLQHAVFVSKGKPRETVEKAFYSMFLAINKSGFVALTVKNSGHHYPDKDVWRRTFWAIFKTENFYKEYKKDANGLLQALQAHLEDVSKRKTAFLRDGKTIIEALDIEVLNEMIETLMFLEQLPAQ